MIILYDNMPARKNTGQGHFCRSSFVRKETPDFAKPEATLGDRIDLPIPEQPEEQAKVIYISEFDKQKYFAHSVWQIDDDQRFDQYIIHRRMQKSRWYPVPHRDSETLALHNGNLERSCTSGQLVAFKNDMKVLKGRRSCSVPKMLHISKTRRDILRLWKHATRHYRGGQEAGRATNQQSIHHVRPWNS